MDDDAEDDGEGEEWTRMGNELRAMCLTMNGGLLPRAVAAV